MTFGEYIEAFACTRLFGKNKTKVEVDLFRAAGSHKGISDEAVKTWISGTRQCDVSRYFPEDLINEINFVRYIKRRTNEQTSWKKLQEAFSSSDAADSVVQSCCIDLETEDPDIFYWSLLNQFQKIFHLPETEQEIETPKMPTQKEVSDEQMRDAFLEDIEHFEIMEIINRKPAILYRTDSVRLNSFLDKMDILTPSRNMFNVSLCASMDAFIEALRMQVLALDATLNTRSKTEGNAAFVNMEEDENEDSEECSERAHELGIPELSLDLILEAADPVNLAKLAVENWRNFQDKMNYLFEDISSWKRKP